MSIVAVIIGFGLPAIIGWVLLSILEQKSAVLYRGERLMIGTAIGLLLSMYLTFLVHLTGIIAINLTGFLVVQLALLGLLFGIKTKWKISNPVSPTMYAHTPSPTWIKVLMTILGLWVLVKLIVLSGSFLFLSPAYLDDSVDIWNLRGKIYFAEKRIELGLPDENGDLTVSGVSSYPPFMPMTKTWFATVAGEWTEPLANTVQLFWFIGTLLIVFYTLRRIISRNWALLGVYILASLPLFVINAVHAYADVFLALHILIPVSMLFAIVKTESDTERQSYFNIFLVSLCALIVTKNEALLIHAPFITALAIATIVKMKLNRKWIVMILACAVATVLPWLIFKWTNGLSFGNGRSIGESSIMFHADVPQAVFINTFLEGNWLLFMPILLGLIAMHFKDAFKSHLVILTLFFLGIYIGELALFMFTPLSNEAIMQTGYARGLVHIVPVGTILLVLLVKQTISASKKAVSLG